MAPTSHLPQINESEAYLTPDAVHLARGFADFIEASTRLEASYSSLQLEVKQLSRELADRNAALKLSLAENERVHQSLRQIVASMPCGVVVVDTHGCVAIINSEARHMLGLTSDLPLRIDAISKAAGVDLQGYMNRVTDGSGEQEFARVDAAGKRWLSVRARALLHGMEPNRGDDEQQTILIVRDITMHKQTELERERARKSIALSEVATTLAHEIRNPLTSLELFAGLISAGDGNATEWISHLHSGIRSLSATVNNVLGFHSNGFLPMAELDIVASVRSSVEFARPIAQEAEVLLEFLEATSTVRAHANSSALQQVVLNMVCNAIRHSVSGGRVKVSVRRIASDVRGGEAVAMIEFRDTGSGIAQEHLHEIFRPGFSGNGSTSGLGLAVCTQIIEQHRGGIQVASVVGQGTSFYVEIPAL